MARAFFSIAAAEGNLGDVFIRRELTRLIANKDMKATVYVGKMSNSYVRAFDMPQNWKLTKSAPEFVLTLLGAVLSGQARVFLAPGPAVFRASLADSVKHFGVMAMFSLVKIRRGQVFVIGRSVRGASKSRIKIERVIAQVADYYGVRDRISIDILRDRVAQVPDLAFAADIDTVKVEPRRYVGISLRYDRGLDLTAVGSLIRFIRSNSLIPLFVTQVREDIPQHEDLSRRFGAEHIDWSSDVEHSYQEKRINSAYQSCVAVVSDRLHALLFSARQGAIPILVDKSDENKIRTTLEEYLALQSVRLDSFESDVSFDLSDEQTMQTKQGMVNAGLALQDSLSSMSNAIRA